MDSSSPCCQLPKKLGYGSMGQHHTSGTQIRQGGCLGMVQEGYQEKMLTVNLFGYLTSIRDSNAHQLTT